MGQSFLYDATKPRDTAFHNSVTVDKTCHMYGRPMEKLRLLDRKTVTVLKEEGNHYLIDLGEECVGLPTLDFHTEVMQKITVCWGEHIADGKVRQKIGGRDFSFEYIAKEGKNNFTNYMLRLGGRYIEVFCEEPIEFEYIGVIPQIYPLEKIEKQLDNPLDKKIYDASVNTLKLCIMEHYVDTPWREQSLYAYDSRNQMLCGYKAFKNKNKEYARANLLLISKDNRDDGILSITYPSGGNLAIPSFSLHYFVSVKEYIEATGDFSLANEVYPKLKSVLEVFLKRFSNGFIHNFSGADYWHFYDWTKYMYYQIGEKAYTTDFMINALFILALESFKIITQKIGQKFEYQSYIDEIRKNLKAEFFNRDKGLFTMQPNTEQYTELVNSVAILSGLATEIEASHIAEMLVLNKLDECSLSMKCFKYDALLSTNKKYQENIVEEIRSIYKNMIDSGSETVWEVSSGAEAFDNAGSLCHGWSATPILYL